MTRFTTSATRCKSVSRSSVVLSTSATSISSDSTSTRCGGVDVTIGSIQDDNSYTRCREPAANNKTARENVLPGGQVLIQRMLFESKDQTHGVASVLLRVGKQMRAMVVELDGTEGEVGAEIKIH